MFREGDDCCARCPGTVVERGSWSECLECGAIYDAGYDYPKCKEPESDDVDGEE